MEQTEGQTIDQAAEKPPVEEPKSNAIALSDNQIMAPKDHKELSAVIGFLGKGGAFPERFKTNEQKLAAYNLSKSLMGDTWQLALNHIAIIKGQMTIYGEFPRTLAERTGKVEKFKVYVVDKDYKEICVKNKNLDKEPFAGICDVKREGRDEESFSYTLEEAKVAGQYPPTKANWVNGQNLGQIPNMDSPWMKALKVMLMRKAQALGVNFVFPEAKVGVLIAEYDFDIAPDITPYREEKTQSAADVFNQTYGNENATKEEENQVPENAREVSPTEVPSTGVPPIN